MSKIMTPTNGMSSIPILEIKKWSGQQIESLDKNQVERLTKDQVKAFSPESISYLRNSSYPNKLIALEKKISSQVCKIPSVSSQTISSSISMVDFLPLQVALLTPTQMGNIIQRHVQELTPEQVSVLNKAQVEVLLRKNLIKFFTPLHI